jgi:hypothetical protein
MLPNFLTRKYHYFAFYKTISVDKQLGQNINPEIQKFIKKYFFLRGRKSLYFEPYTSSRQDTYLMFGTPNGSKGKIFRNGLIFLLEFYSSIMDTSLTISPDFKKTEHRIGDEIVYIYKVKK